MSEWNKIRSGEVKKCTLKGPKSKKIGVEMEKIRPFKETPKGGTLTKKGAIKFV